MTLIGYGTFTIAGSQFSNMSDLLKLETCVKACLTLLLILFEIHEDICAVLKC